MIGALLGLGAFFVVVAGIVALGVYAVRQVDMHAQMRDDTRRRVARVSDALGSQGFGQPATPPAPVPADEQPVRHARR